MNHVTDQKVRDDLGRFAPGCSGNPKGKAPGTRNRATVLRALMRDGDEDAIGRVLIDRALGGDPVAARFLMDGLNPKPRQRTITLDLPEGADAAAIFLAAASAMAGGEISPEEARSVVRFVEDGQRMVQAAADIKRANAAHRAVAAVRAAMTAAAPNAATPVAEPPPDQSTPRAESHPSTPPVPAPAAAPTRRRAAARARARGAACLHSTCKSTIRDTARHPPSQPSPARGEGARAGRAAPLPPAQSDSLPPCGGGLGRGVLPAPAPRL